MSWNICEENLYQTQELIKYDNFYLFDIYAVFLYIIYSIYIRIEIKFYKMTIKPATPWV
jgi:hypothetical protein